MDRTIHPSRASRALHVVLQALLHGALLAALATQSAACLLEPDGDCPRGANPKEHACQARAHAPPADASRIEIDGGARSCPPSATFEDGFATLSAGESTTRGSCGGDSAENFHEFTAEQTGFHEFHTRDSSFDPVLYVRRDTCDGVELACNDDGDEAPESQVTVHLTAGDRVTVVVDGYDRFDSGRYRLVFEVR